MPRLARLAVLVCVIMTAPHAFMATHMARAEVPNWVPEKYRGYFVRHVDERPFWQRALNEVDIELGETGRSFALIAGVSQYPNMSGPEANLRPAAVDVQKLAAYLASEPESFNEIVVLTEADVTVDNLRYFLTVYFPQRLAKAPRSRFLFAYSGHGMTTGKTRQGRGFVLTRQARNLQDRFQAGISLAELRVWLQQVVDEGHQVLALINACYSASFQRFTFAFGKEGSAIPTREGAHAITAGGTGELTWHDPTFGEGSIFFEAVLAALDGRADKLPMDGVVTIGELQTYLHNTVSKFTDERQNPLPGDLLAKGSPGGFFFLDRRRQVERKVVRPLEDGYWLAFGASPPTPQKPTVPPNPLEPAVGTYPKKYQAGETFRDCDECPEMVVVPAGGFTMGSPQGEAGRDDDEGPQHRVAIPRPFAVGVYEVTRAEYATFVEATGRGDGDGCYVWTGAEWKKDSAKSWRDPGFEQTDEHPVACVSWTDADAYVDWLSKETGKAYRLLTEAEWEYAARAGTRTRYSFGDEISDKDGNFNLNVGKTSEVGSYPANPWKLHDMYGNVWEWVEDCWHGDYSGAPADGTVWERENGGDCGFRVLRGGSWDYIPRDLRSANRLWDVTTSRYSYVGFRIARTLSQ